METTETSRLIEMQLQMVVQRNSRQNLQNDLVLKHFDEFYFYARLLFKINILKNKIKE
jgi:hypothetical protein